MVKTIIIHPSCILSVDKNSFSFTVVKEQKKEEEKIANQKKIDDALKRYIEIVHETDLQSTQENPSEGVVNRSFEDDVIDYRFQMNGFNSFPFTITTTNLEGLIRRQNSELIHLEEEFAHFKKDWEKRVNVLQKRHKDEQTQLIHAIHMMDRQKKKGRLRMLGRGKGRKEAIRDVEARNGDVNKASDSGIADYY